MADRARLGLGPCWYLCRECKGSGTKLRHAPVMVRGTKDGNAKRTYLGRGNDVDDQGRCITCNGKGMVLEDHGH